MEITQQQVQTLSRTLNTSLIKMGMAGLQKSFKLNPFYRTKSEFAGFLTRKGVPASLFDAKYKFLYWKDWEQILYWIKLNERKWLEDFGDCDNFAFFYASLISWLFGVNTIGAANCPGHLYNLIATGTPSNFELIIYEPIYAKYTEFKEGATVEPLRVKYTPVNWSYFF